MQKIEKLEKKISLCVCDRRAAYDIPERAWIKLGIFWDVVILILLPSLAYMLLTVNPPNFTGLVLAIVIILVFLGIGFVKIFVLSLRLHHSHYCAARHAILYALLYSGPTS